MTGGKKWDSWGTLDGFLVGEFAWNIVCSDEVDLAFAQCSNFVPSMLEDGGILATHLFDLADGLSKRVAEGSFFRLYQNKDGNVIALYDGLTPSFWLISRNMNSIKEFGAHTGLELGM